MNKTKELKQANVADYFTVDEAAKELGIKPTAIRNYLTWGKLTTYKFKTLTLLDKAEVEEWKERQK
jgi:excisionase family DNA binding protein